MAKKTKHKILRIISIFISLFVAGTLIGAGVIIFWMSTLKLPDTGSLGDRKIIQSTKIYDRSGEIVLWDVHEDVQRTVVSKEDISRHIKNATVAIEDSAFYQHKGIDPAGMFRALLVNIKSGDLTQGGSTISQQLVKNTFLTTDKTFARKIKEIILTLKLEKSLSKDRILELYLNEIPYGGSNYGIEAASKNFFGKTAGDISLAEAAYLASLPKAPTYYSPYGNHLDKLETRKNIVLDRMVSLNFITQKEADEAKEEEVSFLQKGNNSIKAPHFSILIRSYLEEKYGQDVVEQSGLKVITTLDYPLQEKAEELVTRYTKENKEKFNATNGAMVAIDPKTGQLLVMVGSKDYFNREEDGNYNVAIAQRQPGSAIKPFIYATAFEKGYTPETIVFDLQTEFNPSCTPEGMPKEGIKMEADKCYMPGNYDNKFRGPISLRSSLAESLNVPSVKTLYLAGIMDSLKTIKNVGITTLNDPNRYGLTLVLGGGEVSLLEITGAYATLANNGSRNPTTMILKVEDKNGNVLEEYKNEAKQVLDKNITLTVTDILSDNDSRAPAYGLRSPLYFDGFQVAAKTGTTNNSRDAWIVGYTPNIVVGSWVGNNDNTPMVKKTAGFIVAPMWNEFMSDMLKNLPKEDFERPKKKEKRKPVLKGEWLGSRTYQIDSASGKLATEYTPPELIIEKPIIEVRSILSWVDKENPDGPLPDHPENDSQYENWEAAVKKWAEERNLKDQSPEDLPKEKDDVHMPEYAPKIQILNPRSEIIYNSNMVMNISADITSKFEIGQVDYFFNNIYVGSSIKAPFNFSFIPNETGKAINDSQVKIVAYDKYKNKSEATLPIKLNIVQ